MRWIVKAELVRDDGAIESVELGSVERRPAQTATDVGLTLTEAKQLTAQLQHVVVREQLRQYSEEARVCAKCGTRRSVKDYRDRRIASVLGTVHVRVPGCAPVGVPRPRRARPSRACCPSARPRRSDIFR